MANTFIRVLVTFLPLCSLAQEENTGIRFMTGSWNDIKAQAKIENKMIFVDCYATWCGPCKAMEKEVFSNKNVGDFFNDKFLSLKLQMDRKSNDEEEVKKRYIDADYLQNEYKVFNYPSFLFFSSDGVLVHKAEAYQPISAFLKIAQIASAPGKAYDDPFSEYHKLLAKHKSGKKDYSKMLYMIRKAEEAVENDELALLLNDYSSWLLSLPKKEMYTKDNLSLISRYIGSSKSKFFFLFYPKGTKADKVMNSNYFSSDVVDRILQKENIDSVVGVEVSSKWKTFKAKGDSLEEPNWSKLHQLISDQYGKKIADRNVLKAKIKWYETCQQRDKWVIASLFKLQKYGTDLSVEEGMFECNNLGWYIFLNSNDLKQLNAAIKFMKYSVNSKLNERFVNNWDTYANLLYKVGRVEKAIKWEQKALDYVTPRQGDPWERMAKEYRFALENMKKGQPTYLDQHAIWNDATMPKKKPRDD